MTYNQKRGRLTRLEVVIVTVVLLVLGVMFIGRRQCVASGGHYLRGLLWFECVKP